MPSKIVEARRVAQSSGRGFWQPLGSNQNEQIELSNLVTGHVKAHHKMRSAITK
jgi:hypothetical protein